MSRPARLRIAVATGPALRRRFFPPDTWRKLSALGEISVLEPVAGYGSALAASDVLVTSWGCPPLTAEVLSEAPGLRLLAHTGGSVKPYVTEASWRRGVRVTQAGEAMARAVAESAMALTLALLHRVHRFDQALRSGRSWEQARQAPPRHEIRDCPIGVVGASRTGRAYVALARALGADVSLYDPYLSDPGSLGVRAVSLDELLRGSRVLALHAPALPDNRHMIGARELALMPDEALLVNTARSWLVDTDALLAELRTGRLDAALDVYDEEPLPVDHPLRTLPNALLTPHQAGGTAEARWRAGEIVVAEIARFRDGAPLRHEITRDLLSRIG